MRRFLQLYERSHALALKKIEPGYIQVLKMLAAIIAAMLAARRLLIQPEDELIPYEQLVYVAALVIIAPEALRFFLYVYYLLRFAVVSEKAKISGFWEPTKSALNFYYKNKGKSEYPIGGALEVLSPGNITRATDTNGWDPNEIDVEIVGRHQTSDELKDMPIKLAEGEVNRKKYMLSSLQAPFADSVGRLRLRLRLEETNYSTVSGVSREMAKMGEDRHLHISCDPTEKRVPHSLCLHVLCEFDDQQVLMMQRHDQAWYYPGAFSASFEEQFDEHDLRDGGEFAVGHLVSRAVCEEVLPLLGAYLDSPRLAWMQANDFVHSSRLWSVFLEEEIGNFALFCHLRLSVDVPKYVEDYRGLKRQGGRRDREGKLYALKREDVPRLLKNEPVSIPEILIDEIETAEVYGEHVVIEELHPTAHYRLLSSAATKGLIT